MKQMGDKYFKSDSDQCLPLANQVTYKFSNSISVNISNLIPAIKFKLEHIFTIHLFPLKVETQRNFKLSKEKKYCNIAFTGTLQRAGREAWLCRREDH